MWTSFSEWWSKPFDTSGSVWNWALFIGLVFVLVLAWSRVIGMVEVIAED